MTDWNTLLQRLHRADNPSSDIPAPYAFCGDRIPLEALAQGTWWRDRKGKLYNISEDMNPFHAKNALKILWKTRPFKSTIDTPLFNALYLKAAEIYANPLPFR